MNILEFNKKFPNEKSCRVYFKALRDKEGVVCRRCGSREHYWTRTREQYVCKKCNAVTTLRSGTVLEGSKLPYRYWLMAIHLITTTKKPFSALELQRQLGHKRYEPVWAMLHKLRASMGLRDSRYTLTKQVELDEAFIEMTYPKDENDPDDKLKRGRGSQRQVKVLVMAESIDSDKPNAKRKGGKECKHIKMVVMSDLTSETIDKVVEKSIDKEAEVTTDGYRSYKNLKNKVAKHNWLIIPPEEAGKLLPWVHTMISNVKRTLLGTYHMIKGGYMQNYLNEFCYKVNRRYFRDKLFDRLMVAVVSDTWYGKFV